LITDYKINYWNIFTEKADQTELDKTNGDVLDLQSAQTNFLIPKLFIQKKIILKKFLNLNIELKIGPFLKYLQQKRVPVLLVQSPLHVKTWSPLVWSKAEYIPSCPINKFKASIAISLNQQPVQVIYSDRNDFLKKLKFSNSSSDFQKSIGYVNVRSFPVYFYAQRDGNYDAVDTVIPFNKINLNEGTALDGSTGEFLAPLTGKYFFSYSGLCWDNEAKIQLQIRPSGTSPWLKIGDAHCTAFNTLSIQSTLQLVEGDGVRIYLSLGTTHDADGNHFTNFVGWLLEEDIS